MRVEVATILEASRLVGASNPHDYVDHLHYHNHPKRLAKRIRYEQYQSAYK